MIKAIDGERDGGVEFLDGAEGLMREEVAFETADKWVAQRRDSHETMSANSPVVLREKITDACEIAMGRADEVLDELGREARRIGHEALPDRGVSLVYLRKRRRHQRRDGNGSG